MPSHIETCTFCGYDTFDKRLYLVPDVVSIGRTVHDALISLGGFCAPH